MKGLAAIAASETKHSARPVEARTAVVEYCLVEQIEKGAMRDRIDWMRRRQQQIEPTACRPTGASLDDVRLFV